MSHWVDQTVFYHIYPLGLCGCPRSNHYNEPPEHRINDLHAWLEHIAGMGFNGLYIGPLFESGTHGYDTTDYYKVDRRLGDQEDLRRFVSRAHELGIKVILDGVFNHVGRDFWAFQDLLKNREGSAYRDWFMKVDFNADNQHHDGFRYDCWEGHETLVNLNLNNVDVQNHLFGAVRQWVDQYDIDGLRLDAANVMDKGFLSRLASFSHDLKPQFWLMGEVVAGNYNDWANPARLDSVTNYEAHKGLYSSFNDHNFFEIAWTYARQFGSRGLYKGLTLYSFADNHDVNRVASMVKDPAHLSLLYVLLFSMPGAPSVYYGSEFGIKAVKNPGDAPLRPALEISQCLANNQNPELTNLINNLTHLRKTQPALVYGAYHELQKSNEYFAFARVNSEDLAITTMNIASHPVSLYLNLPDGHVRQLVDALHPDEQFSVNGSTLQVDLMPNTARLLVVK